MDCNRYEKGLALREDFVDGNPMLEQYVERYAPSQCSVLEMMVALAEDCEDKIMGDPDLGDRTHVWFWLMMNKLGLDEYDDPHYDDRDVNRIVDRMVNRTFKANGEGGLFGRLKMKEDMRKVEWWYQLNYYLREYYAF